MECIMKLRVTLETWSLLISMDVNFLVIVTLNTTYNTMLGRISLNKAKVIILTLHLLMKFPTPCRIGQVQVDQVIAQKCYMTNLQDVPQVQGKFEHGESKKIIKGKVDDC